MAATPSVKITKQFNYRGTTRQWSNRYHFNGGTPADDSHWHTLFDNITAAEKLALFSNNTIVEATGYAAGSDVPVSSKAYSLAGTGSYSGTQLAPGDCAILCKWTTAARTSKNHPVYLFNYWHSAAFVTSSDADTLATAVKTLWETYASAWLAGFSDGVNTYVRSGPNGATALTRLVDSHIRHRDFRN